MASAAVEPGLAPSSLATPSRSTSRALSIARTSRSTGGPALVPVTTSRSPHALASTNHDRRVGCAGESSPAAAPGPLRRAASRRRRRSAALRSHVSPSGPGARTSHWNTVGTPIVGAFPQRTRMTPRWAGRTNEAAHVHVFDPASPGPRRVRACVDGQTRVRLGGIGRADGERVAVTQRVEHRGPLFRQRRTPLAPIAPRRS